MRLQRKVLITLVSLLAFMTEGGQLMAEERRAVFGGGCFWCMEPPFEQLAGVIEVRAGYTGGTEEDAVYTLVSSGQTGHYEAVEVLYDPQRISYAELVEVFWRQIDPTDPGGQFADRGMHYKTAIFFRDDSEKQLAMASKINLQQSGLFDKAIVTEVLPLQPFYPAEEYHQDYYRKNYSHYSSYKQASGREHFVDTVWPEKMDRQASSYKKPTKEEIRARLTDLQYEVTQKEGTEPPFENAYWNNTAEGVYVDIVSGEPLFSSQNKFKSGTGWPSFDRPLQSENIVEKKDRGLFSVRTEVRSKYGDSHLGHVFDDGPPSTGLRYCINSAALRFVPKENLEREGYGKFLHLFNAP